MIPSPRLIGWGAAWCAVGAVSVPLGALGAWTWVTTISVVAVVADAWRLLREPVPRLGRELPRS